jgi:hypothetical protein
MFSSSQEILIIHQCGQAVMDQVTACLRGEGLDIMQSFDLQSNADAHASCGCANAACACRMQVLLVYEKDGPPATLLVDCAAGRTILSLANHLDDANRPDWVGKLPGLLGNARKS